MRMSEHALMKLRISYDRLVTMLIDQDVYQDSIGLMTFHKQLYIQGIRLFLTTGYFS